MCSPEGSFCLKTESDLVTRLRRRGDRLSLEAAAVIEQLRADSASARTAARRRMSAAVQAGMLKARREDRQVGGFNPESARRVAEAQEFAEKLRPVLGELANLSARQVAAELTQRKIETPAGGNWHPMTVLRLRKRLAQSDQPL